MNRRTFIATAASGSLSRTILGANERIRLGIIGAGNRGQFDMSCANEIGGIEWVAVADVYGERRDAAAKIAGRNIEKYKDYRRLLDRKDIDAIIIAAPDHWHSRMLIDAVKAGKDVFCEKPMTSSALQGLAVVNAVKASGRIVQIGTQQRSIPVIQEAKAKFIDSGLLGTITMAYCYWHRNAGYVMGSIPPELEHKPDDLDWNAWLGPLPKIPYDPKRYYRPFLFWGPSTGPSANLLIHFLDVIHWYLGLRKPLSATASGGIYHFDDGRDVPDVFSGTLTYPERVLVTFDCTPIYQGVREGLDLVFTGSGGRLHVFRSGYRFIPTAAKDSGSELSATGHDGAYHVANWLQCIRSRAKPNADVVESHYLAAACHLMTQAYFQKQLAYWPDTWDLDEV